MPDYVPNAEFESAKLVGPEFEIHNSATSIDFINLVDSWTYPQYTSMLSTWEKDLEGRALIKAIDPITKGWSDDFQYTDLRVKMAIYLLIVSPDYAILK